MPKQQIIVPQEEKTILRLVNEFGCIYYNQLKYFLKDLDEGVLNYYVQYLYNECYIDIVNNDILVPYGFSKYNQDILDCLWIAIDNMSDLDINLIFKGDKPCSLVFQKDSTVNSCIRITKDSLSYLTLLEQLFNTRCMNDDAVPDDFEYIIVIDDEKLIDKIGKKNLIFPHSIALLSDSDTRQEQDIDYFSLK